MPNVTANGIQIEYETFGMVYFYVTFYSFISFHAKECIHDRT